MVQDRTARPWPRRLAGLIPFALVLALTSAAAISCQGRAADVRAEAEAPSAASPPAPQGAATATPKPDASLPYTLTTVRTPDGVSIAAQTWNRAPGTPIVFIHGMAQSHLSWTRQISSALKDKHPIVTYDLRGHGDSDKPLEPAYYAEGRRWGDELKAVIDTLGLSRPVVVGWSLGGAVIANYLRAHGDARLGGVVIVGAVTKMDRALLGDMPPLASPDLATRIDASRRFLRDCFVTPPTGESFETMLAFNAQVPRPVLAAIPGITLDGTDEAFAAMKVPFLVIHGSEDKLVKVGMAKRSAGLVPGAKLSIYEGVGHSPFYEAAPRFNEEIAAFARGARR